MWHPKYVACLRCLSDRSPFRAKGLCTLCYAKDIEFRHMPSERLEGYGSSAEILSREKLEQEYVKSERSLGEIAKLAGCSRQYVHKRLKTLGIPLRTARAARELALRGGKVSYVAPRVGGINKPITLKFHTFDTLFFKTWTPEMAWVLGIIYTDGHLSHGSKTSPTARTTTRTPELHISQKEPELLEKVAAHLKSNAALKFYDRREYQSTVAGAIYDLQLNADLIWDDLHLLGLHPNKSLTIKFPIGWPKNLMRHFIRGCWDGDGSIYRERSGRYGAHFVSGSEDFINGLFHHFHSEGIFPNGVYTQLGGSNPYYYFKILGTQIPPLYRYLYDDVPGSIRLERKAVKFKEAAEFIEARLTHLAAVRAARNRYGSR